MPVSTALVPRREVFAWAMYDFANSGYTTVVLTTIFNAYFVGVIAAQHGAATLWWTLAMGTSNLMVLLVAPVLGAIADHRACKKRFLALTTIGCVIFTTLLGFVGPGDVVPATVLVILASFMFAAGENLIAAFLPEIARQQDMGRVSGYGWSLGYIGGLLVLGICLVYITWAEGQGQGAAQYVSTTMWITAAVFALAALPTFIWLPERVRPQPLPAGYSYVRTGFGRVYQTLSHARHHQDLFRFLISLAIYYCGVNTVVVLAAIYAQQAMGFDTQDTIKLVLIVNISAALGAFAFGYIQDQIGSKRTLSVALVIWIAALVLAYFTESRAAFWVVANLVGIALGSTQSAGRALIGQFAPPRRSAEFFGLWGLAGKFAAIVGPVSYGVITYWSGNNHRLALLATAGFFILGLLVLGSVNESRGRAAAHERR